MLIMFIMIAILFIIGTLGVCYFVNVLTKFDTVNYDMTYLWNEQEYSKEDFDYYR